MSTKLTRVRVKLSLTNQNYSLRKYSFLELIESQPLHVATNLKRNLPKALGLSRQSFANYCNAPIDSSLIINSDRLIMLSYLFNVPPHALINGPIKILKMEDFYPKTTSKAKQISNLTK